MSVRFKNKLRTRSICDWKIDSSLMYSITQANAHTRCFQSLALTHSLVSSECWQTKTKLENFYATYRICFLVKVMKCKKLDRMCESKIRSKEAHTHTNASKTLITFVFPSYVRNTTVSMLIFLCYLDFVLENVTYLSYPKHSWILYCSCIQRKRQSERLQKSFDFYENYYLFRILNRNIYRKLTYSVKIFQSKDKKKKTIFIYCLSIEIFCSELREI